MKPTEQPPPRPPPQHLTPAELEELIAEIGPGLSARTQELLEKLGWVAP